MRELSEAERDAVLVAARDAIPRELAMLAGTGSDSTLLTIRQTKRAAEMALLPGLAIGSSGGILALATIAARELVEIYARARQGRWEEAKELAARMMRAALGIPGRYGIGGLLAALDLQGFYGGPCRAPLGTPDGDAIDDIKGSLASAGLL